MDFGTLYYVYFHLIVVFDCFYIGHGLSSTGYNLYFTEDRSTDLDRDCLYYTVPEKGLNQQLIPYCIRFDFEDRQVNTTPFNHDLFTFDDLRHRNVTSYQLFKWSAPIDVVERYQMFLENVSSIGTDLFYNCTFPWFGRLCEYHFENPQPSFSEQIIINHEKPPDSSDFFSYFSCYTHLRCDFMGHGDPTFGLCLDWRDVCDGKIDCSDGDFDEEHCWELEINECDWETEFRCHNGLCIPIAFLNDDVYNPDCLDRTDEPYVMDNAGFHIHGLPTLLCDDDPSFRCEDKKCRPISKALPVESCDHGRCTTPLAHGCFNRRTDRLLSSFFWNLNVSDECRVAFRCFSAVLSGSHTDNHSCDYEKQYEHALAMKEYCPSLMQLPPMLFGHVRFVYTNDQIEKLNRLPDHYQSVPPDYVCYNRRLCHHQMFPFVIHPPLDLFQDNTLCQPFQEFEQSEYWQRNWVSTMERIGPLFYACSTYYRTVRAVNHSNWYTCQNSSKVISKHRLRDGLQDCFHGDDELYPFSCSLNATKHRFKCQIGNETVCLAHVRIYDGLKDCANGSDELVSEKEEHKTRVSFQTICDGFTELTPVLINGRNETDETECEQFECNNIYTRCDGYWNCLDGADEMNCEWPPLCPPRHHLCLSPVTDNVTCLPIERVNDGKPDCFGYADEREFCRSASLFGHYKCRQSNKCISPIFACAPSFATCGDYSSNGNWCANVNFGFFIPCWAHENPSHAQQALCSMDSVDKAKKRYFSITGNSSYAWTQKLTPISTTSILRSIGVGKSDTSITNAQHSPWYCNGGVQVHRFFFTRNQSQLLCLCHPPYFGEFCRLQNQRVSVTLQMKVSFDWRTALIVLISLHDDRQYLLESYDQIQYLAVRDCNKKFNVHLLYRSRPKTSTNHSIRFDVYSQHSLEHRASWSYPIRFPFLPVHRLAYQLPIPPTKSIAQQCDDRQCGVHGYCSRYINTNNSFCVCDKGWSGSRCELQDQCGCSRDSLCLHSQACLCPLNKFGPRCYAKHEKCSCNNGGTCIYNDERLFKRQEYFCICADGFSGPSCEIQNMRIEVSFGRELSIPSFIFTHFIRTFGPEIPPARQTVFSKLRLDEDYAVVRMQNPFHLAFVELDGKAYYLSYFRLNYTQVSALSWKISPSKRCLSISEVFNDSFAAKPLLHRMKKYYLPCRTHVDLPCFYDDTHICICDPERRQSNCLEFNHNVTYNCEQRAICENNGQCFTDDPKCPTTFICACSQCSYGSRCQFVRSKFDLSLDSILGYQIQRHKSFTKQRASIKFTVGAFSLMLICGIVSNALSILTFRTKKPKEVGSGYYLLTSSCASLCLIILFSVKAAVTIMTHMGVATNRGFLSFNCRVGDFVVKVLLNYVDWLNAFVAVERAVATIQETSFNRRKAIILAKRVIIFVLVLVMLSNLQDLIRRRLIDDDDEHRAWCITEYNPALRTFNLVILILHVIGPFAVNTISIVVIIYKVARRKANLAKKNTYIHHLVQQVKQFKHQLVSPVTLLFLGLPRVVISFSSDCMETPRDPWLVLIGLCVSYIPPILILFIYVLPSDTYRRELLSELKSMRLKMFRCLRS